MAIDTYGSAAAVSQVVVNASGHITSGTNVALGSGTASSNTFLRGDQTYARMWNLILKTADETITSDSTLSPDNTLVLALAANTKYRFRFVVHVVSSSTPNFKYRLTGPASPTVLTFDDFLNTTAAGSSETLRSAYHAADVSVGTNTQAFIVLEGVVHNGANTGNLSFEWAQNTSNGASTTVLAGSSLEYAVVV